MSLRLGGRGIAVAVFVAPCLVALFLAAPARALTEAHRSGSDLVVTADAQKQQLELSFDTDTTEFVIKDDLFGTLSATTPCAAASGEIRCPASGTTRVVVSLGAGADRISTDPFLAATLPFTVYGGRGDDAINTGFLASPITAHGGPGADAILGRLGPDLLYGGPGRDYLNGVDGNDTLRGEDGSDTLIGGDNRDRLFGGGGGNDLLRARDYTQDLRLSCGPGPGDRVRRDSFDPSPTGCP
jgi:hypothetical protein